MFEGRPRVRTLVVIGGGAAAVLALASGCSSDAPSDPVAAASSSTAAALSSAAQASPGDYGMPADPSLPNPTSVATDVPVPTPTGSTASVVLTYADWEPGSSAIEVGAYVPGVVETGGTCTAVASAPGEDAVTASVTAEPDAGSTSCPGLSLPGEGLTSGGWAVRVSYESATVTGTSDPATVVVP